MRGAIAVLLWLSACVPEAIDRTVTDPNADGGAQSNPNDATVRGKPPTAVAGEDIDVQRLAEFVLDGSQSRDPDDDALRFVWRQTEGPAVEIQNAESAVLRLIAPDEVVVLQFELQVFDNQHSDTDTVSITVVDPPNSPPVADAGPDMTVAAQTAITLTGTTSSDPDGDVLSYQWRSLDTPAVPLSDSTSELAGLVAPGVAGLFEFELEVSDGRETDVDSVTVEVFVPVNANKDTARVWEPVTFRAEGEAEWDFGDGNIGFGSVITHQFVQPGQYLVSLNQGEATGTVNVVEDTASQIALASQHQGSGSGMWAMDDIAIVPGISNGILRVVDISDPDNPVRLSTLRNVGPARGARMFGDWVVTAKEGGNTGCDIFDISDPTNPRRVSTLAEGAHNVSIWDNYVILNGASGPASLVIYDVRDPEDPQRIARWDDSDVHDSQMMGDQLFVAGGRSNQFYIVDVSDRSQPTTVKSWRVPSYAHNVWPSGDGQHAYTSEEATGGHLRIWDIAQFNSVVQVSEWNTPSENPVIHNVVVVGDLAYVGWYTYGLSVIDVSNPADPQEIFHYDTLPNSDSSDFDGAWNPVPFGDRITVSDIRGGLYVFTKD